ncbi:hypothetical protein [Roseibacillus ishigakijimensis]|uniref:Uncharacterized protein n=1 Tax=Roseibacillus ishigakijimensis TaxID=454146 RepID=A0A934VNI2_9BACT|nr:hypothetical protein [Roseibacillus ishigakijimensis]MBK1835070.1 hypothetical protein [Roseibacillus ishigakijimensis]
MITPLLSCSLLWALPALGAAPVPIKSTLTFPGGDALSGSPAGLTADGSLLWNSPHFSKKPLPFFTKEIDSIQLFSEVAPQQTAAPLATLTFQSHIDEQSDTLQAELLHFDEETVKVRTWFGGELSLRRAMLDAIEVDDAGQTLFTGPGDPAEWQAVGDDSQAWKIENRKFVSREQGGLAREFPDLPDRYLITFDVQLDYPPYLRLHLCADSGTDNMPETGYSLSLQRNLILFRKRENGRHYNLNPDRFGEPHEFSQDGPTQVAVYLDRQEGTLALTLDGKLATSTTDVEPLTDTHWFHLSSLNDREVIVSNFRILPWDGELPRQNPLLANREELPAAGEQIELQNGDTIIGKATSIVDGKLRIETEYVPVSVPVERLRSFQVTPPGEGEGPRIYAGDVRAYFPQGGHLTLRVADLTATTITGYSQVFGEATFDLRAFTRLEFNPYDPAFRQRRGQPY